MAKVKDHEGKNLLWLTWAAFTGMWILILPGSWQQTPQRRTCERGARRGARWPRAEECPGTPSTSRSRKRQGEDSSPEPQGCGPADIRVLHLRPPQLREDGCLLAGTTKREGDLLPQPQETDARGLGRGLASCSSSRPVNEAAEMLRARFRCDSPPRDTAAGSFEACGGKRSSGDLCVLRVDLMTRSPRCWLCCPHT